MARPRAQIGGRIQNAYDEKNGITDGDARLETPLIVEVTSDRAHFVAPMTRKACNVGRTRRCDNRNSGAGKNGRSEAALKALAINEDPSSPGERRRPDCHELSASQTLR